MSFGKRNIDVQDPRQRPTTRAPEQRTVENNPFGLQNQQIYEQFNRLANILGSGIFLGVMALGAALTFGVPFLLTSLAPATLMKGIVKVSEYDNVLIYGGIALGALFIGGIFLAMIFRSVARFTKPKAASTTTYSVEQVFAIYAFAVALGAAYFIFSTGANVLDMFSGAFWSAESVQAYQERASVPVYQHNLGTLMSFAEYQLIPLIAARALVYGWKDLWERLKDAH